MSIDSTIDSDSTNVDVSSAIANTQDSNFGLVSTSVVNNSQSTESNVNLGLILGVSIPLGLICNSSPIQSLSSSSSSSSVVLATKMEERQWKRLRRKLGIKISRLCD